MRTSLRATLVVLAFAACANATVYLDHEGATDPATEGFGAYMGNGVTPAAVYGDMGYDAWNINTRPNANMWGVYEPSILSAWKTDMFANGWKLSARVRVVDDYLPYAAGADLGLAIWLNVAPYHYDILLGLNDNEETVVGTNGGSSVVIPGPNAYHTYVLQDPDHDTFADLYVDGSLVASGLRGSASDNRLDIGDLTSSSPYVANANYNMVKLESLPEPATLIVLGLGTLGLIRRSR